MKKLILPFIAFSFILSCGPEVPSEGELRELPGGKFAGGVLHMNEVEDFRNLYPLDMTEIGSTHIGSQIYEGLVKLSQADLSIVPAIAESWKKNDDATVWTFKIRKGVKFHDDECFEGGEGRELDAHDIKWSLDNICAASPHNQGYTITLKGRVVGADEYYNSTRDKKPLAGGVSGVKVIDEYTVEVTLVKSFAGFLNILATQYCFIVPKEALAKYGEEGLRAKAVGTGAFALKSVKEGEAVILERNPDYWAKDEHGNQLPYLNKVRFSFIKEKKQEFLEFRKGNLDLLFRIPTENIKDILGELNNAKENKPFDMQITPAMNIFYYGFLNTEKPFNDKRVRLAFNYAIDRKKIVEYTLKGEGIAATHGIVPPAESFGSKGYNFNALKGHTYDPDLAKKLLADAGYPGGKGFPRIILQINSGGGDRNMLTALNVQSMLKENLSIDIGMETLPGTQHWDKLESGKALFWRAGWIADYPDPETFLTLLYSGHIPANATDRSYVNTTRFRNAKYDSLFTAALKEVNDSLRSVLYMQADQVGIDEAAIMPIFYDESYRLIQKNVMNFPINAMEYRDVSRVYFVPDKSKDKKATP